jgi:hypothetical protein
MREWGTTLTRRNEKRPQASVSRGRNNPD